MIEDYRREVIRLVANTEDELLLKQVYTIMYARIYGRKNWTKQNEATRKQIEANVKQNEATLNQNEANAKQNEANAKQNEAKERKKGKKDRKNRKKEKKQKKERQERKKESKERKKGTGSGGRRKRGTGLLLPPVFFCHPLQNSVEDFFWFAVQVHVHPECFPDELVERTVYPCKNLVQQCSIFVDW